MLRRWFNISLRITWSLRMSYSKTGRFSVYDTYISFIQFVVVFQHRIFNVVYIDTIE